MILRMYKFIHICVVLLAIVMAAILLRILNRFHTFFTFSKSTSIFWILLKMTMILLIFVIISDYCFLCCPDGYTFCTTEGGTCNASGIIAYGSDQSPKPYTYQEVSLPVYCGNAIFDDPAPSKGKHCCYQDPILSGPSIISPIVRSISCNETITGYIKESDTDTAHYYQLTTNSIYDITYNLCNVPFDATLTVYNSNGNAISLSICEGAASRPNYGDRCDPNGVCGNTNKEAFILNNQLEDTYYIRIAYFTSLSVWTDSIYYLTIACDGTLYPTTTPTTNVPTTHIPTTFAPTTFIPTTSVPTTFTPTQTPITSIPTTFAPSTYTPTTNAPSTSVPTTFTPSLLPSNIPTKIPSGTPSDIPTDRPTIGPSLSSEGEVGTSSVINTGSKDDDDKLNSNSTSINMVIIGIILGVVIFIVCIICLMLIWYRKKKYNENKNLCETTKVLELTQNNNIATHCMNGVEHNNNVNKITVGVSDTDDDSLLMNDTIPESNNDGEENDIDVLNDVNRITAGIDGNDNINIDMDNDVDILEDVNHVTIGNNNENNYINTPNINEDEFIVDNNNNNTNGYDEEGI
eukprot:203242_1